MTDTQQLSLIPDEVLEGQRGDVDPVVLISKLPPIWRTGPPPTRELIASLKAFGMFQPLVLARAQGTDRLHLVDGRRRLAAAIEAGMAQVPTVTYDYSGPLQAVATLLLNEVRKPNPVAELQAIETLLGHGASESEIAAATGLPKQTIRRRLRLTSLVPALHTAFTEGKLTMAAAEAAAKLPKPKQEGLVPHLAEKTGVSLERVERAKQVSAKESMAALPSSLFSPEAGMPEPPKANPGFSLSYPGNGTMAVLYQGVTFTVTPDQAGELAAALYDFANEEEQEDGNDD